MASYNYIEGDLQAYLIGQSSLLALVPANQIYASFVKANAKFPCVSICAVGQTKERTLSEIIYVTKRIQIDCFAQTYPQTKNLEITLNGLLEGFTGQLKTNSPIRVITCLGGATSDSWLESIDIYRTMMLWEIEYCTAVSASVPLSTQNNGFNYVLPSGLSVNGNTVP